MIFRGACHVQNNLVSHIIVFLSYLQSALCMYTYVRYLYMSHRVDHM